MGRREVGGRSAGAFGGTDGGLQWLWRARWRDRTRQEALADWAGASLRGRWVGWWVSGGRAPSGWEWNGSQSGRGAAELLLPGPALGKMQGQSACRAGDPSGQGKDPSSEGLGGHDLLTQADARCPAGQVVRHHLYRHARRRWRRSGPRGSPTAVFPDRCGALVRQFYLDGQWGAPLHRTAFHDLGGNGLPYRF